MDLNTALKTLNAEFKVDEDGTTLVTTTENVVKELTLNEIDLAIINHRRDLDKIASSSMIGGMQWHHQQSIEALKKVRGIVLTSGGKNIPSIDPERAPSLFDSSEYRDMVDVMGSHKLYKTVGPTLDFGYTVMCRTCGEMASDTDEELHVAHQLLLAGFRKS